MSDPTRPARRPNPTPAEKAERTRLRPSRVAWIAELIRRLEFRSRDTSAGLAIEWDLPVSVVQDYVREASAIVREEYTHHDKVLSKVGVALDEVIDRALASGNNHDVIKAVQVWAHVTGAGAETKVRITQDLAGLSPEQLAARKAELLARLSAPGSSDPKGE